jgi:hypothetical protein
MNDRSYGGRAALLVLFGAALVAAACGGSSNPRASATPAATGIASTPTPGANAQATRIAASPASKLDSALLQAGDLPVRLTRIGSGVQALAKSEVPGLTSDATGNTARFATTAGDEFFNETAIVPDDLAAVQSMMAQFGTDLYLQGLTGSATDAQSSPLALVGAPTTAKAIHYSGTSVVGGAADHVEGEAIAFTHGRVFALLIHGAHNPALPPLDLGALAALIDARLSQVPEVN